MAEVNEKHLNEIIDNIVENRVNEVHDKNNLLTALLINMNENLYSAIKESVANEIQKQFNNQNIHANQNSSQIIHLNNNTLDANILTPSKVDNDNSASDQSLKSFAFLANRGKYIIAALLFVLILIILAAVYGHLQTDDKSALRLVTRDEWNARPHGDSLVPLNIPVERVIVCHTASDICETLDACKYRVNVIQNLHMDSMDFDDIGYNFLLGSDGRIYEGRGWDLQGAHTKGYNENSLGIAFIGTFNTSKPNDAQLRAFSFLIEEAVRLKKLVANYKLYGARQFAPTESPGSAFYEMIQTWPHWTNEVNNGNI